MRALWVLTELTSRSTQRLVSWRRYPAPTSARRQREGFLLAREARSASAVRLRLYANAEAMLPAREAPAAQTRPGARRRRKDASPRLKSHLKRQTKKLRRLRAAAQDRLVRRVLADTAWLA